MNAMDDPIQPGRLLSNALESLPSGGARLLGCLANGRRGLCDLTEDRSEPHCGLFLQLKPGKDILLCRTPTLRSPDRAVAGLFRRLADGIAGLGDAIELLLGLGAAVYLNFDVDVFGHF